MRKLLVLFLMAVSITSLSAKVVLPDIIASHMVLQQCDSIKLWGHGSSGTVIKITPSWGQKTYKTVVNEKGEWQVAVYTPSAGGPYNIVFDDGDKIILEDVLIGEVWLCSGQSNMGMPMKGFPGQPVAYANDYITRAKKKVPLRIYTVSNHSSAVPLEHSGGQWKCHDSGAVANCSATAYFFGKYLQEVLGIPVGIVISAWNGSNIETWMSRESFRALDILSVAKRPVHQTPSLLYNAMIYPIRNLAVKGMIWYQGEANRNKPEEYARLFPAFVQDIRNTFQKPELPFYYVQIAPFAYSSSEGIEGASLREVQLKCASQIPHSGMVVTLDIGEQGCIHPAKKKEVGERLAYYALAKTYGYKYTCYTGPEYRSMTVRENRAILKFSTPLAYGVGPVGQELNGFEVAGSDRKFYPGKAVVDSKSSSVIVHSEKVSVPVAVRYAYRNYVEASLFSECGLPASSFRTDDW